MRIVGQAPSRCDRRGDASFGLIGGDADVDVGPASAGLGWMEGLVRHVRIASVPIHDVLAWPETPVPERCGPERTDVAAGILGDGDPDLLDLGRVCLELQCPGLGRDPLRQLDISTFLEALGIDSSTLDGFVPPHPLQCLRRARAEHVEVLVIVGKKFTIRLKIDLKKADDLALYGDRQQ